MRLEGQPNFRDVGGMETTHGALVRGRRLLRSGDFGAASDADLARLATFGDLLVYDLRSCREAGETPDRLPEGWSRVHLPIDEADGIRDLILDRITSGDLTPPPGDLMAEAYRRIVARWTDTLADLMHRLAHDRRPSVVHCTQGKDRTGIAVALVLSALGVRWLDIETDYLRSNEQRADYNEATMSIRMSHQPPTAAAHLRTLGREIGGRLLDVLSSTPPGPPPDFSSQSTHLHALATGAGETCGGPP